MKRKNIKLISTIASIAGVSIIALPIILTSTSCSTPVVNKKLIFDQSINFTDIYGKDFKQPDNTKGANEIFTSDSKIFAWDVTSSLTKYVLKFLVDPNKNIESNYKFQGEIVNNSVVNNKYNLDVTFKLNKAAIWNDASTIKYIQSFDFKMNGSELALASSGDVAKPIDMLFSPDTTISFNYNFTTDSNQVPAAVSIVDTLEKDSSNNIVFKSNYLVYDKLN